MIKNDYPQKVSKRDRAILKTAIDDLFDENLHECYLTEIPEEPEWTYGGDRKEYDAWESLVDKLIAEKQKLLAQELVKIVTKKFKL
jgi:hypothetical protein